MKIISFEIIYGTITGCCQADLCQLSFFGFKCTCLLHCSLCSSWWRCHRWSIGMFSYFWFSIFLSFVFFFFNWINSHCLLHKYHLYHSYHYQSVKAHTHSCMVDFCVFCIWQKCYLVEILWSCLYKCSYVSILSIMV